MKINLIIFCTAFRPRSVQSVPVEGEYIAKALDHPISASVDRDYDLRGRTLLPGLIDAHAHVYLTETYPARRHSGRIDHRARDPSYTQVAQKEIYHGSRRRRGRLGHPRGGPPW